MRTLKLFTIIALLMVSGAVLADAGAIDAGAQAADAAAAVADAGPAAAQVDPGDDPVGFLKKSYDLLKNKQWWPLASMLVVLVVFGMRKWLPKVDWFRTDRGGTVLAFSVAFLGALAHGILAGQSPDLDLLQSGFKIGIGAIGGYTGFKKLIKNESKPAEA